MKKILIIHGPNLNMLGIREPNIYGSTTLDELNKSLKQQIIGKNVELDFFQSNIEGEIINKIHESYFDKIDFIIINPGAFTHYSYGICDAISSTNLPVIEVHLSNIHKREEFRKKSVIAPVCIGQISGLGIASYSLALEYAINYLDVK